MRPEAAACTPTTRSREHLRSSAAGRADGAIEKTFSFANFHQTMAFVNALAWIAHAEDHHPELRSATTAAGALQHPFGGGISINDFICAAKVDALPASAEQASARPGLVVAATAATTSSRRRRQRCLPPARQEERLRGRRPVRWQPTGDEGVIEHVEPRRNLLFRQDEWRTKSLRRQPRPAAGAGGRRAGVQRVAAGARADRRRERRHPRAHRAEQDRPAAAPTPRASAWRRTRDGHRRCIELALKAAPDEAARARWRRCSPAARRWCSAPAAPARAR